MNGSEITGGWVGVDLDGTLAQKDGDYVEGKIGWPVFKMVSFVNYSIIRDDILSQNKDYILHWVAVLQPAGIITSGEASTINSYVNRTISDPTWTATLTEPTPASRLFPNTNWIGSDGSFTATPTIDDVAAAR